MRLLPVFAFATLCLVSAQALPAFPGAEGFGTETPGGRGGKVYVVSNLNDAGPGSFREACEAAEPRFVVFAVSGTIELTKDIKIRSSFITIAGQTAPGDGICLKNYSLTMKDMHDAVVRYIRVRPGDGAKKEMDAIGVGPCERVVFDHVSASFGIDETLSITHSRDCTVQWSFITDSLNHSVHKKGNHGYGSLISGPDGGQSWHHNLYAHHKSRCPRGGSAEGEVGIVLDFRNNVVYDWLFRSGYSGDAAVRVNYVANYLKPGPSTPEENSARAWWCGGVKTKIYVAGNEHLGAPKQAKKEQSLLVSSGGEFPEDVDVKTCIEEKPFDAPEVKIVPVERSFDLVLKHAGASLKRDTLDAQVAEEVRKGTGKVIDTPAEVGGWPELKSAPAPADADQDGMPDAWETSHGLDPKNAADAAQDRDGDGYTNIEEYVNGLVPAENL